MRISKAKFWAGQVDAQRKWIDAHGGDIIGYVNRYGSYGNGGAAIYAADKAALDAALEKASKWK